MNNQYLSKNFSFAELTDSKQHPELVAANRARASKDPYLTNLQALATALQIIRDAWGKPIYVNSGIRSPALNAAIGGSKTSDHVKGFAADLDTDDNVGLGELIVKLMKSGKLEFSQVIFEKTRKRGTSEGWIHFAISYPGSPNYGEVLVYDGQTYRITEVIPKKK